MSVVYSIVKFEVMIKTKSEKIKALTLEITKHQEQIEGLKNRIKLSDLRINKTQNDFAVSYDHLKLKLLEDIIFSIINLYFSEFESNNSVGLDFS